MIKNFTIYLLLNTSLLMGTIENSVIPTLEKFESVENLEAAKFTKNQFAEMVAALDKKDQKIRLATFNMLFNLYDHKLEEINRWPARAPRIQEMLTHMDADIISTQELYPDQVKDLMDLVGHEYSFFEGQKDSDGESFGILYRTNRFQLLSGRIVYPLSMVELKDLKTDKIVQVFNTHMPLSNIEKREENARLIVETLEPLAQEKAVIFTGDLNTFDERMELPLPFYDGAYIHRILSSGSMKNSHETSLLGHFGPLSTFTNQDPEILPFQGIGTPGIILDYIYTSKHVTVLAHATEPGKVDGNFPSDHMPVVIDFIIH